MTDRSMPMPSTVLQILSSQTRQDAFDCPECDGAGERQIFDAETGVDYALCEACLGSGYNMLGLLVHGLLKPPAEGYGPQELKGELERRNRTDSEKPIEGATEPIPSASNADVKPAPHHQTDNRTATRLRLIS